MISTFAPDSSTLALMVSASSLEITVVVARVAEPFSSLNSSVPVLSVGISGNLLLSDEQADRSVSKRHVI